MERGGIMEFINVKDNLDKFFKRYRQQIKVSDLIKKFDLNSDMIDVVLECLFQLEKEGKIICLDNMTYMHVPVDFYYSFGSLQKSNSSQYYVKLKDGSRVLVKNVRNAKDGDYVFVTKQPGNHPKCFVGEIKRVVKKVQDTNLNHYIIQGELKKDGSHYYVTINDARIYIPKENLNTAFVGDLVNIKVQSKIGSVLEVLKRKRQAHVFKCVRVRDQLMWAPVGVSYGYYSIPYGKYEEGDRVVASIDGSTLNVLEKLENHHSIEDDINSLIIDFGFANEFSTEVMDETKKIIHHSESVVCDNRVDLRNLETFTIDPVDAKDLDDAVSLVKEGDIYHLYVHLADPSHYIQFDSCLFQEALRRSFSVYPTTDVIPMLPDLISSGVCSLNEDGDKYAITCRMDINSSGDIVDFDLFKSVIHSNKQMNYDEVNDFLNHYHCIDYLPFKDTLDKMCELSNILNRKKNYRGAISFEGEDRHFLLDDLKNPIGIVENQRGEAELIIENFMLLANERIAEYANDLGLPYFYRNHDKPSIQKGTYLKHNLNQYGYFIQKLGNIEQPKILQHVLNYLLKEKKKDERRLICEMFLKTMTRAYYSDTNMGHYGLALDCYGTFTSPARKISDLVNHMVIKEFLNHHDVTSSRMEQYRNFIHESYEYISSKQRDADLLEQEINHLMLNKYSDGFLGLSVNARIMFINRYGIYVKDEHGLTGVIPVHGKRIIHDNSIIIHGCRYYVNEQISVVLKERNDDELVFDFGEKCKKKILKKKDD